PFKLQGPGTRPHKETGSGSTNWKSLRPAISRSTRLPEEDRQEEAAVREERPEHFNGSSRTARPLPTLEPGTPITMRRTAGGAPFWLWIQGPARRSRSTELQPNGSG